jgi:hypothetical protein
MYWSTLAALAAAVAAAVKSSSVIAAVPTFAVHSSKLHCDCTVGSVKFEVATRACGMWCVLI